MYYFNVHCTPTSTTYNSSLDKMNHKFSEWKINWLMQTIFFKLFRYQHRSLSFHVNVIQHFIHSRQLCARGIENCKYLLSGNFQSPNLKDILTQWNKNSFYLMVGSIWIPDSGTTKTICDRQDNPGKSFSIHSLTWLCKSVKFIVALIYFVNILMAYYYYYIMIMLSKLVNHIYNMQYQIKNTPI